MCRTTRCDVPRSVTWASCEPGHNPLNRTSRTYGTPVTNAPNGQEGDEGDDGDAIT